MLHTGSVASALQRQAPVPFAPESHRPFAAHGLHGFAQVAFHHPYWHVHAQPKNCWTFDLDVRPWKTKPWFNSAQFTV